MTPVSRGSVRSPLCSTTGCFGWDDAGWPFQAVSNCYRPSDFGGRTPVPVSNGTQTVSICFKTVSKAGSHAPPHRSGMNPDGSDKRSSKSLRHLGALPGIPPATTAGKVLWAWPQISAALQRGWRMANVWAALREDGIEVPYDHFRVYVSRIRRRLARSSMPPPAAQTPTGVQANFGQAATASIESAAPPTSPAPTADPYSAVRAQRRLKQQSGFEYDPFSSDKDLLE
jgi:hypothetical protein